MIEREDEWCCEEVADDAEAFALGLNDEFEPHNYDACIERQEEDYADHLRCGDPHGGDGPND